VLSILISEVLPSIDYKISGSRKAVLRTWVLTVGLDDSYLYINFFLIELGIIRRLVYSYTGSITAYVSYQVI
jgi:hypothetical protein